jgi:hypothetical protein
MSIVLDAWAVVAMFKGESAGTRVRAVIAGLAGRKSRRRL